MTHIVRKTRQALLKPFEFSKEKETKTSGFDDWLFIMKSY